MSKRAAPSLIAKRKGCHGLKHVARASGMSQHTLINWSTGDDKSRHFVFDAICEKVAREQNLGKMVACMACLEVQPERAEPCRRCGNGHPKMLAHEWGNNNG